MVLRSSECGWRKLQPLAHTPPTTKLDVSRARLLGSRPIYSVLHGVRRTSMVLCCHAARSALRKSFAAHWHKSNLPLSDDWERHKTCEEESQIPITGGHHGSVTCPGMTQDGSTGCCKNRSESIALWETRRGEEDLLLVGLGAGCPGSSDPIHNPLDQCGAPDTRAGELRSLLAAGAETAKTQ
ncbi:hypothetical protein MAPG_03348 [Magnaporthiopsis poae ATCC 64411]|uniref:Uncharacterized protein n=1 Tax=Magnaporthiopsis poae (strain ATCC 64411 / 73-15) TaxID=644358 RepID=A0A0C4DTS5_MAGP6|nr:hypothetical protein MAPG_03348 [Magnaporthiopsis poae ATCC 64411]